MALINCTECTKRYSSNAKHCPECANPTEFSILNEETSPVKSKKVEPLPQEKIETQSWVKPNYESSDLELTPHKENDKITIWNVIVVAVGVLILINLFLKIDTNPNGNVSSTVSFTTNFVSMIVVGLSLIFYIKKNLKKTFFCWNTVELENNVDPIKEEAIKLKKYPFRKDLLFALFLVLCGLTPSGAGMTSVIATTLHIFLCLYFIFKQKRVHLTKTIASFIILGVISLSFTDKVAVTPNSIQGTWKMENLNTGSATIIFNNGGSGAIIAIGQESNGRVIEILEPITYVIKGKDIIVSHSKRNGIKYWLDSKGRLRSSTGSQYRHIIK
jgi:hypothetical protein